MKKDKEEKVVEFKPIKLSGEVEIIPDKDFRITHNEHDIKLVKGESKPVPKKFLQNLLTEGVISKLPKL